MGCVAVTPPAEQSETGSEPQNIRRGALLAFPALSGAARCKLSEEEVGLFLQRHEDGSGEQRNGRRGATFAAIPDPLNVPRAAWRSGSGGGVRIEGSAGLTNLR